MTTNFSTFEQLLSDAEIDFSTSFVHGILAAYCCKHSLRVDWPSILLPHFDKKNTIHQSLIDNCQSLKQEMTEQLADENFSFQLMLDENAQSITEEVLSYREWVSGYWLGLQNISLPPQAIETESLEFIKDLPRIVSIPLPEASDIDQSETLADLIELQEYCRVGVISLFLASWQPTNK